MAGRVGLSRRPPVPQGRAREAAKLLWDCLATEFGGRHELYEINYGGSTEEIRRYIRVPYHVGDGA